MLYLLSILAKLLFDVQVSHLLPGRKDPHTVIMLANLKQYMNFFQAS